jgi:chemotaxis protein methyltransferase CheR
LKILWDLEMTLGYPGVTLSIVATDIDEAMLARAREGCFKPTSLRELPPHLVDQAFTREESLSCVKPAHRQGIDFLHQDLRIDAPQSRFDLILCRYLAFTYFSPALQRQVLDRLIDRLLLNGYLAIGMHERLPESSMLTSLADAPQILQKGSAAD